MKVGDGLRYADDTTLMAESEEELKSLLMKVKEESERVSLKLTNQKTKIMPSGPITSWEIDGETVSDFIFGGSKITADSSSKATLWVKTQHEGALTPPCIIRKDPGFHTQLDQGPENP